MASSIGPARNNLWQLLQGLDWPEGFQVGFGFPDMPAYKGVFLLGVSSPAENIVVVGPGMANEERYGIEVAIKFQDPEAPEDQAADTDLAAWDCQSRLRAAVMGNRTLSGAVVDAHVSSQRSPGTGHPLPVDGNQHTGGLLCVIETTVACLARAS